MELVIVSIEVLTHLKFDITGIIIMVVSSLLKCLYSCIVI